MGFFSFDNQATNHDDDAVMHEMVVQGYRAPLSDHLNKLYSAQSCCCGIYAHRAQQIVTEQNKVTCDTGRRNNDPRKLQQQ